MAVITLPLTFQNSFWSQDYRVGLEVLFDQLEKGIVENEEIVAFIRARASAEAAIAAALEPSASTGKAFDNHEGASLHVAFRGLKEEMSKVVKLHEGMAEDLTTKVADPFGQWANGYKERLYATRANLVEGYLHAYEQAQEEVERLKKIYIDKMHKADELEDDVRFAPITQPAGESYRSPSLVPRDRRGPPKPPSRQPTVSERISARLKEFRLAGSPGPTPTTENKPEIHFDADTEEKEHGTPKINKGKGRALDDEANILASPPPLSPALPPAKLVINPTQAPPAPPIVVAGIEFTAQELSELMTKAKSELPLRAVRFPLLGEYKDAFTGEDFTQWLREKVKPLEGDLDRAEDAAKELTEEQGLLRRLGELGNTYENSDDAYYTFRPKAFNLEVPKPAIEKMVTPIEKNLSPLAEGVVKRTTGFASLVTKALNAQPAEAPYVKARREAEVADQEYRVSVRKLDRQRLGLEERIEDTLKILQKWELERLRAVKTVLSQYQSSLEGLSKDLPSALERSSNLVASYQPESDIKAFIEQHRTGPFRPNPHLYESVAHDEADVVFGIDLRKWADSGFWSANGGEERKDIIPPVLTSLLGALSDAYARLPNDSERRKTWIYEVPLTAVHHLRETLNSVPDMQDVPDDTLAKYDPPVIASALKLWFLELDPPICMYETWDEFKKLYPSGVKTEEEDSENQHIQGLQNALLKLPKVHLYVLDTFVKHLVDLIECTDESDEDDEIFITKLSLGFGRSILRPKVETKFSIQDRHPTQLFKDLIISYNEIIPPTLLKKKRESDRKLPVRKRTRPMDMRMSRSRISAGADLKELAAQQLEQRGLKPKPPVPKVPEHLKQPEPPVDEAETHMITDEPDSLATTPIATQPGSRNPSPAPVNYANIPPPPSFASQGAPPVIPPPPPLTRPSGDYGLPPRPQFREPSPDRPASPPLPMPNFIEPPSTPPLPMPNFTDPPPEPASPPPSVSPRPNSRPASPIVHQGGANISRRTSGTANTSSGASRLSGPRTARGPRPAGNVGNIVSSFNQRTPTHGTGISRPSSPATNSGTSAGRSPQRPMSGQVKRSSAMFERRTMASDAEDDIIQ